MMCLSACDVLECPQGELGEVDRSVNDATVATRLKKDGCVVVNKLIHEMGVVTLDAVERGC